MLRLLRISPGRVQILVVFLLLLFFSRWLPQDSLSFSMGDSGMFLFAGQQIDRGLAPYSEVWDHKSPLIFYVNALGLRMADGSSRGVLLLTYLFTLAFCALTWLVAYRWVGTYPAVFAVLLVVNLLPALILAPNLTEVFALPFQAASFLLMAKEFGGSDKARYPVAQGLLAALLFQLRPNNAAVSVLYLLVCAYGCLRARAVRPPIARVGLFALSFVISNLCILSPILIRGGWSDYVFAAFTYGLDYATQKSALRHPYAVCVGLLLVSGYGASLIASAMAIVLLRAKLAWSRVSDRFAILALLLFFLEICFSSVSGRAYEHYFLMWLLPLALLSALFVGRLEMLSRARSEEPGFPAAAFLGACALLVFSSAFDGLRTFAQSGEKLIDRRASLVRFVRERSAPSDRAFVWGDRGGDLAFRLGLRPASRFFSTVPMTHDVRCYRWMASEALRDVEKGRPRFILESPGNELPGLFSPAAGDREGPAMSAWENGELLNQKRRLGQTYSLVLADADSGVKVYELKSPGGDGAL